LNFFRKYIVTRQTKKLLEEILAAPQHSQDRLFLSDSEQLCPLNAPLPTRADSESRIVAILVVLMVAIWATIQSQKQNSAGQRLSLPPGALLNYLADFFCAPKTMERVVGPIISDMQKEYCEALSGGRHMKARWIRLRGYCSFWKALGLYVAITNLREMWKMSRLG